MKEKGSSEVSIRVVSSRKYYHLINAYIKDERVGTCKITREYWTPVFNDNKVISCFVHSFVSEKGILRALYTKAIEVIKEIAKSNRENIEDQVVFSDENSKEKMKYLFKDLGYNKIQDDLYVRVYGC